MKTRIGTVILEVLKMYTPCEPAILFLVSTIKKRLYIFIRMCIAPSFVLSKKLEIPCNVIPAAHKKVDLYVLIIKILQLKTHTTWCHPMLLTHPQAYTHV